MKQDRKQRYVSKADQFTSTILKFWGNNFQIKSCIDYFFQI